MAQFTTLLVGAHFRPPAKQVLAHLPVGTQLTLEPEPDNPYDPLAIKVFVDPALIPESQFSALDKELLETGNTIEQIMSGGPIWLGYVPAAEGKPLAKARANGELDLIGNDKVREIGALGESEYAATLAFGPDGSPRMILETREYP